MVSILTQIKRQLYAILVLVCLSYGVAANTITVVTEQMPPFQIIDGDRISGSATAKVRKVFEAAGIDYVIKAHPWHISYNLTLKNPNTCIYSISRSAEREALFLWIGRLAEITPSFYTSLDSPVSFDTLEAARLHKTAVLRDDLTHQFLLSQGFVEDKQLYVSESYESLFNLLDVSSRGIDLVISNDLLVQERFGHAALQNKYKKVMDIKELKVMLYLACHPETPQDVITKLRTLLHH